jgi:hypothetical protein
MEPVKQTRFQLKITPLLLILVAVGIPIAMQQYKLAAARTSYERIQQAWIGMYVTCEDVVVSSNELKEVEYRWLWSSYDHAEDQHLSRLKQLLKEAEAKKLVTMWGSLEASEHEVNVLRKAISDIEQP